MKNKLGFYARYSKIDGSLISHEIKGSMDVYKSNNNNQSFLWELITDDERLMYVYPIGAIPVKSESFDLSMSKESNSNYFQCDLCGEYFTENEMYHMPTEEGVDDGECFECNNCSGS